MNRLAAKSSLLLFGGVLVALRFFAPVSAEPAKDITVAPFLQSVQIEPADSQKSFSLKLTNNTAAQQTFYLSAVDFSGLNETGGVLYEGAGSNTLLKKYGLAKWISLPSSQITLGGTKTAYLEVTVKNDPALQPGGHYGAVIFTSKNPNSTGGHVGLNQQVSALIFATKKGGEKYDLHLESVTSNKTLFKQPTKTVVRFKNTGNTQVVPRGVVYVKSGNKVLARGVINEQSGYILPETFRTFDVPLRPVANSNNLFVGKYTLQTDYRYDGYEQFASSSTSYLVFNVFGLSAVVALMVLTAAVYKSRRNRPVKKAGGDSGSKIPVKTSSKK